MKKILFVLAVLALCGQFSSAQEVVATTKPLSNAEINKTPHEIGIAAGFVTGYGLSYRYWPKKLGVQLTAFPLISNDKSYLSLGVTGLLELDSRDWYRFFAYLGGNVNIQSYDETYYSYSSYDPLNTDYTTVSIKDKKYTVGFGPGIEFTPGGKIGFNIMTGFQFYYVDKEDWGTLPTIEGGIFFRF